MLSDAERREQEIEGLQAENLLFVLSTQHSSLSTSFKGGLSMGKKLAFMGAGAVGSYIGGYFCRHGEDVTLIDPWPDHIEAIKREGLHLEGTQGEYLVHPRALLPRPRAPRAAGLMRVATRCVERQTEIRRYQVRRRGMVRAGSLRHIELS